MPKIRWLEIEGFRAFGATRQRLEFSSNLQLLWGPNSQGKTSAAEAFEFLLTGGTVRRESLGSAKAEFNGCLRNVHLSTDAPVYVAAGVEDGDGVVHDVKRMLLSDYTAQDDCTSTLTIDGQPAQDLGALGFRMSEPPLQAPILMQHTVRFVVSARPQERADYFKAILEIHDLEAVREEISGLLNTLDVSPSQILLKLRRCASIPGFEPAPRSIEESGSTQSSLEKALSEGLGKVLESADVPREQLPEQLAARVAKLRSIMTSRREATFPLPALFPPATTDLAFNQPGLPNVRAFTVATAEVAEESAKLSQVFQAVLGLPQVSGIEGPIDCPVCETPLALTPVRVAAIRAHVDELLDFEQKRMTAKTELDDLRRTAQTAIRAAQAMLPPAVQWDDAARETFRTVVTELVLEQGAEYYNRFLLSVDDLRTKVSVVESRLADFLESLREAERKVAEGQSADIAAIDTCAIAFTSALEEVNRARTASQVVADVLARSLRDEIDRRAKVDGWEDLVHIAEHPDLLARAVADQLARITVRKELEGAVEAIDEAKADVFDEKFKALSAEITRWWNLLRPDELVAFGGVRRRGTGRRFVDFKALLHAASGVEPVERDAAGVLSDSQLNCLGLAAFLARCTSESTPAVLLDDPTLAADEEHRTTFARYVVEELLRGPQVILTTYDEKLCKLIEEYYGHISADVFSIVISDPTAGPIVTKTSNTLESMLARAQHYLRNQSPEIRKIGSERLREVAERLCKEIIVRGRRNEGREASLVDFDEKNLGQLIPEVEPYLSDPSHPGKLRAIPKLLNPGSHDDAIPAAADLGVAYGDLQKFKRCYLR